MSGTVSINDRLGVTLREFLIPEFQKNFFLLANLPLLRYFGMEKGDEAEGRGSGSGKRPRIESVSEKVDSAFKFQIAHKNTPFGGGTYAQPIGAQLRAGKFQGIQSNAKVKFITQSMLIPAQVIQASRRPELSIVNEVVENMEGAAHVMQMEFNRMALAPTTHALCVLQGGVSGAKTFTVATNTSHTNETPATQYLQTNDQLLIGTSGQIAAGTAQAVTIDQVTGDTTFTSTDNETCNDGDLVVRADVYDTSAAEYVDLTSMASFVNNTGTVQGLNKASYKFFQSYVSNVGGALTQFAINNMANATRRYSPNPQARFLLGNYVQWQRYSALLVTQKTYDSSKFDGNLVGGVGGLDVYTPDGSLPFFVDDMVPDGTIYLLDPSAFKWFEFRPFGPADDALGMGGYPAQRQPGTLNYEFALWMSGQIGQVNALPNGVLTGITA